MNATATPGSTDVDMALSLAPVPYFWPREHLLAFYDAVAGWPVDRVYLGEVVCAKRRSLDLEDWIALGHRLQSAGKEVAISSLTLIEAGSEAGAMQRLCRECPFPVEANDTGVMHVLHRLGKPFLCGPAINIYNAGTLNHLRQLGLLGYVLPVELGADTLSALTEAVPEVPAEVIAWGRLPLSWSARCFTARAENRPRDHCQLACLEDPEGRVLSTREGQPFLVLNGTQTQSALTCNLAPWLDSVKRAGAAALRITPQPEAMSTVVAAFDRLRRPDPDAQALAELERCAPTGTCDGFWHGAAGFEKLALSDGE